MYISSIELPNLDKKPEKRPLASLQYMEKDYVVIFYCYLRVLEKTFFILCFRHQKTYCSSNNILTQHVGQAVKKAHSRKKECADFILY